MSPLIFNTTKLLAQWSAWKSATSPWSPDRIPLCCFKLFRFCFCFNNQNTVQ